MTKRVDRRFADFVLSGSPMMTPYESFEQVVHFQAWEWGDIDDGRHMDLALVWKMDLMREIAGEKVKIVPWHPNGGYAPDGHKKGSWHAHPELGKLRCYANDFHIDNFELPEMFRLAVLLRFSAIGVYPYWNNKGLHVDTRPDPDGTPSLWMRNSRGQYTGLSESYKRLLI